jgi:ribokinase
VTTVAAIGYASLDHAMAVGTFHGTAGTTLVRRRLSDPWPDHGGFAHVTREVARRGLPAEAVSWLGPDEAGRSYLDRLRRDRVGIRGVAVTGSRTPSTYLLYAEDGATVCVYDPGDCTQGTLTAEQRDVVGRCDWLVVTVGPSGATRQALDVLPDGARLAWTVKPDPDAFPEDLARRLLRRADVVTFGAGEGGFLAAVTGAVPPEGCRPDALVVRTGGAGRVRYWSAGRAGELDVPVVSGVDTTGAGDTFVAGLVAALATGAGHVEAVGSAADGATDLLRRRAARQRAAAGGRGEWASGNEG